MTDDNVRVLADPAARDTASAEVTREDMAPLPACASAPASVVDARTEPSHTCAHI